MTIFDSIILGLVQGLTEFIPVSSSGHLIIVREWLGINNSSGLAFDAVLQLATVLAVLVYFRKDVLRLIQTAIYYAMGKVTDESSRVELLSIIIGTLPAILFGILLESKMETAFRSVYVVVAALGVGSVIMLLAEYEAKKREYSEKLTHVKAIVIGFFQVLALVPGISRSGATISGGLFAGLSREEAARISFLLSIPILLGSGLKKLVDVIQGEEAMINYLQLGLGSITAFVVGLFAIHFLISYLKKHTLNIFAWYRIALAILLLIIFAYVLGTDICPFLKG